MKRAFWLIFLVMAAVYATMALWTLPTISAAAGGLAPFDMRPLGYSFEEARAFLAALTEEGRHLYLDVQHRLDLVYPLLLAATLVLGCLLLTASTPLRALVIAAALSGMVFDYLENAAVADMLTAGHQQLTAALVAEASRWTLLKSLATTVAMLLVLGLLLWRVFARRHAKS